jgi:hypothetical protein
MIINCNRHNFFCMFLTNNIFIKKFINLYKREKFKYREEKKYIYLIILFLVMEVVDVFLFYHLLFSLILHFQIQEQKNDYIFHILQILLKLIQMLSKFYLKFKTYKQDYQHVYIDHHILDKEMLFYPNHHYYYHLNKIKLI